MKEKDDSALQKYLNILNFPTFRYVTPTNFNRPSANATNHVQDKCKEGALFRCFSITGTGMTTVRV